MLANLSDVITLGLFTSDKNNAGSSRDTPSQSVTQFGECAARVLRVVSIDHYTIDWALVSKTEYLLTVKLLSNVIMKTNTDVFTEV